MAVKKGYKQTEVGVIPQEWNVSSLANLLLTKQLGGNYRNSEQQSDYPLIKMGNIGRGKIQLEKIDYIDRKQHADEKDKLYLNDVLFNTRNTLLLVGKVAIWKKELPLAYFNSNIMRMQFDDAVISSNPFMCYILNTPKTLEFLRGVAIGTTSVAAIYSRDFAYIPIPIPPVREQEAIAGALSDADAWIESLEQLIAKKRQIKQGAMQELLTGKRRLPGFRGEWDNTELAGNVALKSGHHVLATYCNESGYGKPYLTGPSDFPNGKVLSTKFTTNPTTLCRKDDILVTVKGSGCGTIAVADAEYCISRQLAALTIIHGDSRFIYYSLERAAIAFRDSASGLIPGLSRSDILRQRLPMPPTTLEQTAIATVLSDMDTEIESLESKLAKGREIKQGLMHELLTGRIRLV